MDEWETIHPAANRSRTKHAALGIFFVVLSILSYTFHFCIAPLDPWIVDAPIWLGLDMMPGHDARLARADELLPWIMLAHLAGIVAASLLLTTGVLLINGRRFAPYLGIFWVLSKVALALAFGWLTLLIFDAQVAAIPDPVVPRYMAGMVELGLWTGNLPLLLARTIPVAVLLGCFVWCIRRRTSP